MKRVALFLVLAVFALAPLAHASNITLYPTFSGGSQIKGVEGAAAPGFSTGSWGQAGSTKGEVYLTPAMLFGHDARATPS